MHQADTFAPSSAARSLCWRGPQPLQRMRTGLQEAMDGWARAWGLPVAGVELDNAWEAPTPDSVAWQPMAADADGAPIAWLGLRGAAEAGLEQLIFGTDRPGSESPTLSRSLARDALSDLRRRLSQWLGAAPAGPAGSGDGPPAADVRAWSGAVRATMDLQGADASVALCLHVRAAAWPRPTGTRGTQSLSTWPPLNPLPEALAAKPLQLQARLADVQVTLGELMGLREGDVLVTGHRLAEPLSVSSQGSETPVFSGRLVQRQGRMAVALVPTR